MDEQELFGRVVQVYDTDKVLRELPLTETLLAVLRCSDQLSDDDIREAKGAIDYENLYRSTLINSQTKVT